MPGAKTPARTKISSAGLPNAASGTKKGKAHHKVTALMVNEISEPVMALDSFKPRRISIWAMEKHNAAWKEK